MDGAKEDLVDMFIVHTVEEIQVIRTAVQIFNLRISDHSQSLTGYNIELSLSINPVNQSTFISVTLGLGAHLRAER